MPSPKACNQQLVREDASEIAFAEERRFIDHKRSLFAVVATTNLFVKRNGHAVSISGQGSTDSLPIRLEMKRLLPLMDPCEAIAYKTMHRTNTSLPKLVDM